MCCTEAQVADFYLRVAVGFEVDHIAPLAQGGLHCLKNLQILTIEEHRVKTSAELSAAAPARGVGQSAAGFVRMRIKAGVRPRRAFTRLIPGTSL